MIEDFMGYIADRRSSVVAALVRLPPRPAETSGSSEACAPKSFTVDVMELADMAPATLDLLVGDAAKYLDMCKTAMINCQKNTGQGSIMDEVVPRLVHLPSCPDLKMPAREACRSEMAGRIVVLSGTVIRSTAKRVVARRYSYMCPVCRAPAVYDCDRGIVHKGGAPKVPCANKQCKGALCSNMSTTWMDYAECRLQERVFSAGWGSSTPSGGRRVPQSVLISLEHDLCTSCVAGQSVEVVGVVTHRWQKVFHRAVPVVEVIIVANNIALQKSEAVNPESKPQVQQLAERFWATYVDRPLVGRDALVSSFCPHIAGMLPVKLALLLAAVGGVEVESASGDKTLCRIRGDVHVLLVGDPSTGKSQLIRQASLIAPRSVCTTGITSTSAGLTASATKEFGEWGLEPGALVLSDGGMCIIDELRTVKEQDRTTLHEAMEQQSISFAKAGLVTQLSTRCSVVAACNPPSYRRGKNKDTMGFQVGIGAPLLSRFDCIFRLADEVDPTWDAQVADRILDGASATADTAFDFNQLKSYIDHVREAIHPSLSAEAVDLLSSYYRIQRLKGQPGGGALHVQPPTDESLRVTVRLLESLIRLAQAHAKLLFRAVVSEQDAAAAVFLLECTEHHAGILDKPNVVHMGALECPEAERDAVVHRVREFIAALEATDAQDAPSPGTTQSPLLAARRSDDRGWGQRGLDEAAGQLLSAVTQARGRNRPGAAVGGAAEHSASAAGAGFMATPTRDPSVALYSVSPDRPHHDATPPPLPATDTHTPSHTTQQPRSQRSASELLSALTNVRTGANHAGAKRPRDAFGMMDGFAFRD